MWLWARIHMGHRPTPPLRPWIRPSRARSVPAAGWERGTRPPQAGGVSHPGQHGERTSAERASRPGSAPSTALPDGSCRVRAFRQAADRAPADGEAWLGTFSDDTPGPSCK